MAFWLTQYLKSLGDNFGQVTPLIYRSAQPSADRLKELRAKCKVEINLNLRDDFGDEERNEILQAGMIPYNVPMKDDEAPAPWQILKALNVLREGNEVKLVNCVGGRHRTGLICAVYQAVEMNVSKRDAWKEAEKYGYYDHGGHAPLRLWFEDGFQPGDYR